MSVYDLLDIPVTGPERLLLRCGLTEWLGPARCTDELAAAIGFGDAADFLREGQRLAAALADGRPLTQLDWVRTLLATEICFASDVVGAGLDWPITSSLSDEESIRLLRSVQRKNPAGGVLGVAFGSLPQQ